ncbi:MAG TPA: DUF429 domain-containing protein [Planctomycetota bacterium]|nr:DUF429 domain-containing protein [Planctomycetota bacterium]
MRTLGVDLASAASRTATCVVDWEPGRATVTHLAIRADDNMILNLAGDADAVGIDAPFGWPTPFVELVSAAPAHQDWTPDHRDDLRFRRTDHHIRRETGRWPLSVSSDLIGVVAMRCHGLLHQLGVGDRVGHERVFEVYPAAALRRWARSPVSYKGSKRRAALGRLAGELFAGVPWLEVKVEYADLLRRSDDALDALVSSLVARAAKIDLVDRPPEDPRCRHEGWIALPKEGSLSVLVG